MPGSSIVTDKSGDNLSEEDAKKLLQSLDPRIMEQIMELQRSQASHGMAEDAVSSVSGYCSSNNLVLPDHDDPAVGAVSPSLKRVSLGQMSAKSGGVFHKKKSIPSLVLTFDAANKFITNAMDAAKEDDKETVSSVTGRGTV